MSLPTVLFDHLLVGTPLRGLIVQGPVCLCAYLGLPLKHWGASLPELEFPCHLGITFEGEGDGLLRPSGWYWYGWDYGHAGDRLSLSGALKNINFREPLLAKNEKAWSLAEVEQDLLDSAMALNEALVAASRSSELVLGRVQQSTAQPPSR